MSVNLRFPIPQKLGALASIFVAASLLNTAAVNPASAETATVDGHDIYYEVHGDLAAGETPILLSMAA